MSSLDSTLSFVQQQLIRYVFPTYLIFGVTGCCLNIILFTQRPLRTISCCLYFTIASVTMLIALLAGPIPYIYSLNHDNPFTTIGAVCKIRTYILQFSTMTCRWCLTFACLDRYVLTSTNARLRNFANVRIAYRIIAVITIMWLVLPAQSLFIFDVRGSGCGILNNIGVSLYFSCYTILIGSVLPVSIMVVCAILIRRNLVLKRQRLRQLNNNEQNNSEHSHRKRDQQVFVMLLLQIFVYIVTQTPWMLLYFYSTATIYTLNKSPDRIAIERFISFATELIIYLLPVLSFYLYTLASRTFREELMKVLRCPVRDRWRNANNRIHPKTTTVPGGINLEPVRTLAQS